MKPQLYDVLIELPHPDRLQHSNISRVNAKKYAGARKWPILKRSDNGVEIKATQRDLRRYRTLRRALSPLTRLSRGQSPNLAHTVEEPDEENEQAHLLYTHDRRGSDEEDELRAGEEKSVERISWSALAYSSFMWWASAGD
jgi:hypothetical protein